MLKFIGIIGNLLGIGKGFLDNRAKLKQLEAEQKYAIIAAETDAIVDQIKSNTQSDNEIDLITARNKRYTMKDEVITYLFLIPVFVASVIPFVVAWQDDDWVNLNNHIQSSYNSLDGLPSWYKYVLFAIVIDVLGFRSFARKLVERWYSRNNKSKNSK